MTGTGDKNRGIETNYLRRWWRVRRNIFLCFFFRMRLRRFLINEPMREATLPEGAIRPRSGHYRR